MFFVDQKTKRHLLKDLLEHSAAEIPSVLVFTRTKHGADRVVKDLVRAGITAQAIHGNKSQNARQNALNNFKSRETRVLVATDIAARGIDIDELTHVINYEIPNIPETYVHRIGRTGRAGHSGVAWSFVDAEERAYLKDIQRLIKMDIPVEKEHAFLPGTKIEGASIPSRNANALRPAQVRHVANRPLDRAPIRAVLPEIETVERNLPGAQTESGHRKEKVVRHVHQMANVPARAASPGLDAVVVPEARVPLEIPDGEPRTPIDLPWEIEVAEIARREIPKRKTRKAG